MYRRSIVLKSYMRMIDEERPIQRHYVEMPGIFEGIANIGRDSENVHKA